jgi:hypothetical protein
VNIVKGIVYSVTFLMNVLRLVIMSISHADHTKAILRQPAADDYNNIMDFGMPGIFPRKGSSSDALFLSLPYFSPSPATARAPFEFPLLWGGEVVRLG